MQTSLVSSFDHQSTNDHDEHKVLDHHDHGPRIISNVTKLFFRLTLAGVEMPKYQLFRSKDQALKIFNNHYFQVIHLRIDCGFVSQEPESIQLL